MISSPGEALASLMAWASEPAPLLPVLMTVKVAACAETAPKKKAPARAANEKRILIRISGCLFHIA
jgi:hypothetical protein